MFAIALVGVAGAVGTILRHAVGLGVARIAEGPWATLAVNVVGSLALGVIAESLGERRIAGVDARLVLGTGAMGGFTTYSTFNLETLRLIERGQHAAATLYVIGTVLGCLVAGAVGIAIGRAIR